MDAGQGSQAHGTAGPDFPQTASGSGTSCMQLWALLRLVKGTQHTGGSLLLKVLLVLLME